MKSMVKLGLTLLAICVVASLALGVTNEVTSPIIVQRGIQANNELRQAVLPEAKDFAQVKESVYKGIGDGMVAEVYEGLDDTGEVVGYTIKTTPSGYGGAIELMVGLSTDGKITGVKTGTMAETPGLGSKAADPAFIDQYKDKTAAALEVAKGSASGENQILAISGATITSTAVTNGVNTAIEVYNSALNK